MKASGIITVLGGVGALALLGLMVVMGGDETEPVRPPVSESRAGTSATPEGTARGRGAASSQAPGTAPSRSGTAPQPSSGGSRPAAPSAAGGAEASAQQAQAGATGEAGATGMGAAGTAGTAGTSREVQKVLEVARRAERVDERINAVRWLGENGAPEQFDALQDIQINDPAPEVRQAAETAVNTLRTRRANEPWPGVTPKANPQDYMRGVTLPSP